MENVWYAECMTEWLSQDLRKKI